MRLVGFITIFLAALKLLGVISWSWLWVTSPMWGSFILGWFILIINDIVEDKIERERGDSDGTE